VSISEEKKGGEEFNENAGQIIGKKKFNLTAGEEKESTKI